MKTIQEEEADNEQEEEKPAKKKVKYEAGGSKVKSTLSSKERDLLFQYTV
jgi:hypothetical protein